MLYICSMFHGFTQNARFSNLLGSIDYQNNHISSIYLIIKLRQQQYLTEGYSTPSVHVNGAEIMIFFKHEGLLTNIAAAGCINFVDINIFTS